MTQGRPSLYKPEIHIPLLFETYSKGYGYGTFCADAGIGETTFYRWQEDHEEFRAAFNIAKMQSMKWWEEMGMDGLTCKEGFNATLFKFFTANKFGWVSENKMIKQELSTGDSKLVIDMSGTSDKKS